jgi:hypothetical protein
MDFHECDDHALPPKYTGIVVRPIEPYQQEYIATSLALLPSSQYLNIGLK